jgi:hypothetical protein
MARIVLIAVALYAGGEILLPTSGVEGFLSRAAVVLLFPPLLYASGFFEPDELRYLRTLRDRVRSRLEASAEAPEDLEALQRRAELMEDMHEP